MIYGGTTPTHKFTLPIDTEDVSVVRVLYAPKAGHPILIKTKDSCTLEGNTVSVRLTQEDTLLLDNEKAVVVQLRVLLNDGTALTSAKHTIKTYECMEEVVME